MILAIVIAVFLVPTVAFLCWQFFTGDQLDKPLSDGWGRRWSEPHDNE